MPNRTPDFRYIFANTIGFAFTDNESRIIFAISEDMEKTESATEQVGVILTHKTLKLLGMLINETIEHYERTTGTVIPLDADKAASIRATLNREDATPAST